MRQVHISALDFRRDCLGPAVLRVGRVYRSRAANFFLKRLDYCRAVGLLLNQTAVNQMAIRGSSRIVVLRPYAHLFQCLRETPAPASLIHQIPVRLVPYPALTHYPAAGPFLRRIESTVPRIYPLAVSE